MKNLFIPYELAVIAKEKGFDRMCLTYYYKPKTSTKIYLALRYLDEVGYKNEENKNTTAPLYQQIVDWFREKHRIHIIIAPYLGHYGYIVKKITISAHVVNNIQGRATEFENHRECLNAAITEVFKLIP